jgi:hypothetical protein
MMVTPFFSIGAAKTSLARIAARASLTTSIARIAHLLVNRVC